MALLYVNYFKNSGRTQTTPKSSVALFADDTRLYIKDRNPKSAIIQLQRQMDLAAVWFDKWHLRKNSQKTILIFFGQLAIHEQRISLKGHLLQWEIYAKYFGVHFDRIVIFNTHVNNLIKKLPILRT